MQLKALAIAALLLGAASPASAGICTLVVVNSGALGLSSDGAHLGSDENRGLAATVSVMSIGPSTLTVSAPSLTQYPGGYNPSDLALEVAYRGTGALASVSQPYTMTQTSVPVPNLLQEILLTLDNRITTPTGFAAGTYQTRTVVTCS